MAHEVLYDMYGHVVSLPLLLLAGPKKVLKLSMQQPHCSFYLFITMFLFHSLLLFLFLVIPPSALFLSCSCRFIAWFYSRATRSHLQASSSIFKNEPGSNLSWSSSQSRASNLNVWAAFDIDSILLVKVNQVEKMAKTEANAIEQMKMASVQFIETRFNHSINFNRVLFASCSLPFISVYCRSDCTEATGIR